MKAILLTLLLTTIGTAQHKPEYVVKVTATTGVASVRAELITKDGHYKPDRNLPNGQTTPIIFYLDCEQRTTLRLASKDKIVVQVDTETKTVYRRTGKVFRLRLRTDCSGVR
jgi:hypothetical protein